MASTQFDLQLTTEKDWDIIQYLDRFKDDSERNVIVKKALRSYIEEERGTKKVSENIENMSRLMDKLLVEFQEIKRNKSVETIVDEPVDKQEFEFIEAEANLDKLLGE